MINLLADCVFLPVHPIPAGFGFRAVQLYTRLELGPDDGRPDRSFTKRGS